MNAIVIIDDGTGKLSYYWAYYDGESNGISIYREYSQDTDNMKSGEDYVDEIMHKAALINQLCEPFELLNRSWQATLFGSTEKIKIILAEPLSEKIEKKHDIPELVDNDIPELIDASDDESSSFMLPDAQNIEKTVEKTTTEEPPEDVKKLYQDLCVSYVFTMGCKSCQSGNKFCYGYGFRGDKENQFCFFCGHYASDHFAMKKK
jgi:hypothetical protein